MTHGRMKHFYLPFGHSSIVVHVQRDDLAIPLRLDDQFKPQLGKPAGSLCSRIGRRLAPIMAIVDTSSFARSSTASFPGVDSPTRALRILLAFSAQMETGVAP